MAVTPRDVQDYAVGTLEEWIKGYDVPDEGPQHRYRVAESSDGRSLVVRVESCAMGDDSLQEFRITLDVEAL